MNWFGPLTVVVALIYSGYWRPKAGTFEVLLHFTSFWLMLACYLHRIIVFDLHAKLQNTEIPPCLRCCGSTKVMDGILNCDKCGTTVDLQFAQEAWSQLLPEACRHFAAPTRQMSRKELTDKAGSGFLAGTMLLMMAACLLPLFLLSVTIGAVAVGIPAFFGMGFITQGFEARRLIAQIDKRICFYCGYSLQGLDSRPCPECGERLEIVDKVTEMTAQNTFDFGLGKVYLYYAFAMACTFLLAFGLLLIAHAEAVFEFNERGMSLTPQFPLWKDLQAGRADVSTLVFQMFNEQAIDAAKMLPPLMIGTTVFVGLALLFWRQYLKAGIRIRRLREWRHRRMLAIQPKVPSNATMEPTHF